MQHRNVRTAGASNYVLHRQAALERDTDCSERNHDLRLSTRILCYVIKRLTLRLIKQRKSQPIRSSSGTGQDTVAILHATRFIAVRSEDLRTNSDYYAIQHKLTGSATETECVYCAVRDESLRFRLIIFGLSPRTPGLNPRSVHVRFIADEVALGQVYLPVFRSSPVSIISPMLHSQSPSPTCRSYEKNNRAKPGNLRKRKYFNIDRVT